MGKIHNWNKIKDMGKEPYWINSKTKRVIAIIPNYDIWCVYLLDSEDAPLPQNRIFGGTKVSALKFAINWMRNHQRG